jgi:hypothetical protein
MTWFEIRIKDLNMKFKLDQALIPPSYNRYMKGTIEALYLL